MNSGLEALNSLIKTEADGLLHEKGLIRVWKDTEKYLLVEATSWT
ncbi:hypothetical protein QFZ77_007530 [Paenibacillus sp. V4I3]|nr:hypothetical protein [Paenibacillus sp. V4I3]